MVLDFQSTRRDIPDPDLTTDIVEAREKIVVFFFKLCDLRMVFSPLMLGQYSQASDNEDQAVPRT